MIDFIYATLASLGYTHPLHPAVVHIPMGMILGGFLFKLFSFKWPALEKTAYNCFMLALAFVPVTALLGILDWQHRLLGHWSRLIIAKFILAGILTALLAFIAVLHQRETTSPRLMMLLYTLCLIAAMGIGFVGGQLVYG
jgi:uncharacterized membrane protein